MSATGRITGAVEGKPYHYYAKPDLAFPERVEGISIRLEELSNGQAVQIVQMGDGGSATYGFAPYNDSKTVDLTVRVGKSPIKGVMAVPQQLKSAIIDANPAQFSAAYIGFCAGLYTKLYELGEVKAVDEYLGYLSVEYLTSNRIFGTFKMRCEGVKAADFKVNDIALIDCHSYSRHAVVGWWDLVARLIWITVTINAIAGGGGTVNIVDDKGFYDETFYPWRSSKQFNSGSKLTATAWVHPADHVFAGWSGDIESSNTVIQFEPTKDTNLTINSTRLPVPYYIVGNNYCTTATTTMQMETPNQPATFTAEPKLTRSLRSAVRTETAAQLEITEYDAYTEIEYNADFTYDLTTLANADQWDKDSGRYWHKITVSGTFVNVNIRNRYASQGADGDIQYWYRVTRDDGYTNTTYGALAPGQIAWINYASEHTLSATVYIRPIRYTCVYWYRQYNYYMQSAVVWALSNKFQATINAPESSNLNTQQQNTFYPQVAVTYLPNPFNEE